MTGRWSVHRGLPDTTAARALADLIAEGARRELGEGYDDALVRVLVRRTPGGFVARVTIGSPPARMRGLAGRASTPEGALRRLAYVAAARCERRRRGLQIAREALRAAAAEEAGRERRIEALARTVDPDYYARFPGCYGGPFPALLEARADLVDALARRAAAL